MEAWEQRWGPYLGRGAKEFHSSLLYWCFLPLLSSDIAASKDGQDFAAGYCHCLNAVSNFLSSDGSSLNQNIKSQILRQLEDASKVRSTVAPNQSPKIWQPQEANLPSTKPHLRQSSAFFCVTAPALLPPGTAMTLPALETQSRPREQMSQSPALGSQLPLLPSLSRTLTTPPATPQMWRPWWTATWKTVPTWFTY